MASRTVEVFAVAIDQLTRGPIRELRRHVPSVKFMRLLPARTAVVPFLELRIPPADPGAPASDPRNDQLESGRLQDCVPGNPAVLARIVANPENFYVNVHNARFPGGSLRCQLEA